MKHAKALRGGNVEFIGGGDLGDAATITNATLIGGTATSVCALFKGVTGGEPSQTSSVPDGVACVATGITLK